MRARAIYDGLGLDVSLESQALRYYATLQGVAYGTRAIVDALNAHGYRIETVMVTGGGTKNPLWLQEHADALGLSLRLPEEGEAVLLGSAILAATASGLHANVPAAMKAMSRIGSKVEPRPQWRAYHDAKFAIFREMEQQQRQRRVAMKDF